MREFIDIVKSLDIVPLQEGEGMRRVGNKIYSVCTNCGDIVQVNKPIVGGAHICTTDEEQKNFAAEIKTKYERNKKRLEQM